MHPWRPIASEYGGLLFSFCTVSGEELRDIELVHNAMDENSLSLLITGKMENSRHEEVAAARCLGVTASISASTISHSSSSSELSVEDSEDGDS
jgi:hypothetical protein